MRPKLRTQWRGMIRFLPVSLIVMMSIVSSESVSQEAWAQSLPPSKEEGLWLVAEKDGIFRIAPCQAGDPHLCGWLVGMDYTTTEPEKDIWGRSECGLQIISDMQRDHDGRWNGHILDPRSGHTYQARLWVNASDQLKLLGYVGLPLFGQVQRWTRYQGPPIGPHCRMAPGVK